MATPLPLKYSQFIIKGIVLMSQKTPALPARKGQNPGIRPGIHSDPMPALKTEVGRGLTDATHIPTPDGWTTHRRRDSRGAPGVR